MSDGLDLRLARNRVDREIPVIWQQHLIADPTPWLLAEGQPWVVYRTLVDILDGSEKDPHVEAARAGVAEAPAVRVILDTQRPDGGWEADTFCYSCSSQHQGDTMGLLSVLADFGFTVADQRIARACEFALRFQTDTGDFRVSVDDHKSFVCLSANTVRSLAALGLGSDERVRRAYDYMIQTSRLDGGWIHSKSAQTGKRREHIPSCPHATLNVLWAFSEDAELRESEVARQGAEVLLCHWEERTRPYGWGIGSTWSKLKYPYTWYGLLKYADVLSRFPAVRNDPRLREVADVLLEKQDDDGRWKAESVYQYWRGFCFGQKKAPSPWITQLALRVVKRVYG
jgi:hypothetical protein